MTSDMQTIFIILLGGVIELAALASGAYAISRRFRIALIDKKAEAAVDLATANHKNFQTYGESIDLHNKAVLALLERDLQLVELNRRVAQAESRVQTLEMKLAETEAALQVERRLREALQRQLDEERNRNLIHTRKTKPIHGATE